MKKRIFFKYKGKVLRIEAKNLGFLGRIRGLMFRSKNTENLIFEFKKPEKIRIHSFFVFFEFVGIWLDKNNEVLQVRVVKPFTFSISSPGPFRKLIEIPMNKKNSELIRLLVGD